MELALREGTAADMDTTYQSFRSIIQSAVAASTSSGYRPSAIEADRMLYYSANAYNERAVQLITTVAAAYGLDEAAIEPYISRQDHRPVPLGLEGVAALAQRMGSWSEDKVDALAMGLHADHHIERAIDLQTLLALSVIHPDGPEREYLLGSEFARACYREDLSRAWSTHEQTIQGALDYARIRAEVLTGRADLDPTGWAHLADGLQRIRDWRQTMLDVERIQAVAGGSSYPIRPSRRSTPGMRLASP
ncbi:hypothetical protein ACFQX6_67030 [Streptosporangium lutulentum]